MVAAGPHIASPRFARKRAGIQLHLPADLPSTDVEDVDGIPCLTVTRLVLDAAHARDDRLLKRLWREARKQQRLDAGAIRERLPGRRGQGLVEALLAEDEPDTTNDFERVVFGLLEGLGLGEPEREVPVGRFRLDFLFPHLRWCLEADGFETHGTKEAFAADRDRDLELYRLHGILTHRVAWRTAHHRFTHVQDQLRDAAAVRAREVAVSQERAVGSSGG